MPQMRDTMSSTSSGVRPTTSASKYRGASKIWRCASDTAPSWRVRCSDPSPSTRVRFWTWKRRSVPWPIVDLPGSVCGRAEAQGPLGAPRGRPFLGELRPVRLRWHHRQHRAAPEAIRDGTEDGARAGEPGKQPAHVFGCHPAERGSVGVPARETVDIRALPPAEAAVAAPAHGRADRAAPRLRHRAQARLAPGDHDTGDPSALALEADSLVGKLWPPPGGERGQQLDRLMAVDGGPPKL